MGRIEEDDMNEITLGIAACIFLLVFFLTGIELAFGIAITGVVGYALLSGFDSAFNLLAHDFMDTFSAYSLTVIPSLCSWVR